MNLNFVINTANINSAAYYSLLERMIDKIKKIQEDFGAVDFAEMQLYETFKDERDNDKVAVLTLRCKEKQLIEYSLSKRWEDALLNACDAIRERIRL